MIALSLALALASTQDVAPHRLCGFREDVRGHAVLSSYDGLESIRLTDAMLIKMDRGPDGASRDGDSWCVNLVRGDDGQVTIENPQRIARRELLLGRYTSRHL